MNTRVIRILCSATVLLAAVLWLVACGAAPEPTAEPTQAPTEATAVPPTEPPEAPAETEPAATPEEAKLFPPQMPSAERGKAVYAVNCAVCHGEDGDGSGLVGAADFTDVQFMRAEKPAEFFEAIRDGVEGTSMPAWGETLSEMDIWDVLYFEWSFSTSPEEIAQGTALLAANCVACHGEEGDGSGLEGAANFTDQEFMANEDPAEFFESISEGVEGTAMPAWREQFTEEEIWALVNAVWTFAYEYAGESAEAPTPPPAEPTAPPEEGEPFPPEMPSAVRGKKVFAANCQGCHGEAGDGSGLEGAADFTDVEFMREEKPYEFFEAIRDGIEGTAMPAWGDSLSEMDIWDVLYYEWTFATSQEELAEGSALFETNCAACHGEAGDGSGLAGAANFTDQEFMADEDPAEFFEKITEGVDGTAMPAWGETFSEDQIWALVNYVWSFAYEHDEEAEAPPPTVTLPAEPDPAVGQRVWAQKPCSGCHGAQAEGGIGPKLAGTALDVDEVLLQVRTGAAPMPAFSEEEISDLDVEHIYAWLRSLAPPTPTPAPAPAALPPSGHLMAFWEHVNKVKVHSDFAKDASPDIGTLHGRVNQAKEEADGALREADMAIADIPDQKVQATINQVKGLVSQIISHADAALATNDLNAARSEAAHMVEISRLDAWPLATQAVKQAGFTGSVRVQVKDPSGRPIQGALVTALTAPNPSAGRTDGNGRVTISDLAAVRVMQVKAYEDGLVYHEVHVRVPTGGRADAEITLPGPSVAGQAPVVSNAVISPSSGSGSARVTFRMTGTDPQGHANIAEDQVFALNPDLGKAYVLRSAGGDNWETSVTLPNLAPGSHTWYFFIVDHQCNTSSIVPLTYTAQ